MSQLFQTGIVVSRGNSTSVPLGAGQSFIGSTDDVTSYEEIDINVAGDPGNASGELYFEFSPDGVNWDVSILVGGSFLSSPTIVPQHLRVVLPFFRVRFINDNIPQTSFRLTVIYHRTTGTRLTRYLNQYMDNTEGVLVTRSVIDGYRSDGSYGHISASLANHLVVDSNITDGTSFVGITDVLGAKALKVDVIKTVASGGAGSGGTSSNFGDPFPIAGTAAGYTDGYYMRNATVYDLDTSPNTEFVIGTNLRTYGPGGSAETGVFTNPLRIDPTGNTIQPISGTVTVDQGTIPWITHDTIADGYLQSILANQTNGTQVISGTVTANAGTGTFTVGGTVTANIGTTNGLALDSSVNGILVSQGSTTSGEKGPLIQGAVTTSSPSYTTAQTSPLSLTTAGALRIDGSAVVQPVSGTVTANAGSGTFTVGGTVTANIGTTGGLALDATLTGGTAKTQIYDGTNVIGTSSHPVRVDPTGTTTQPVSGTVTANIGTTGGLALDTSVNGILVSQGSTTSGEKGPLIQGAVTTAAPSYSNAQTSPLSLTPAGALRIDGSAVTQPVSGTVTANAGTGTFTVAGTVTSNIGTTGGLALDATVAKLTIAQGTALGSNTQALMGGSVTTSAPTYVTGNINPLSLTTAGALRVDGSGVTQPVSGTVTANAGTGTFTVGGTVTSNQGTANTLANAWSVEVTDGTNVLGTSSHPIRVDPTGTTTQPVSGTVTANIGTTGGLALDTSVNGLLLSQGSTTSGEKGPLIQGAVTTSSPSYTTTQTSPLSLTTAGALRIDGSATTQPVSGTVTANQGTNPWTDDVTDRAARLLGVIYGSQGQQLKQTPTNFNTQVEIAVGSTLIDPRSIRALTSSDTVTVVQPTAANLNATVTGTVTSNQGTANTLSSAWPVEITDGTNVLGTSTHPVRVDPTGTTTQPVQDVRSSTATDTSVAASIISVTLLSSNTNRLGATFWNDSSSATLYLKLGTTASTSSYTAQVLPSGYYEVPFGYTGEIDGIWSAAVGNVRISELT